MSIRVYEAYKVPLALSNEAIRALETKELELKYLKYKLRLVELKAKYKEASLEDLCFELHRRASEVSLTHGNSKDYFDCGLNIYIKGSNAYLVPFSTATPLVDLPDYFEDFHYQDAVDNDDLSPQENEYRKGVWEELFKLPCFGYDIINVANQLPNRIFEFEKRYKQELALKKEY